MFASLQKVFVVASLGLSFVIPQGFAAPADTPVLDRRQNSGVSKAFSIRRNEYVELYESLNTPIPADAYGGPLTVNLFWRSQGTEDTIIAFTKSNTDTLDRALHIKIGAIDAPIRLSHQIGGVWGTAKETFTVQQVSQEFNFHTFERLIRFTIEPHIFPGKVPGTGFKLTFAPTYAKADKLVVKYRLPNRLPNTFVGNYFYYQNNSNPRIGSEIHVTYGTPLFR